ncbi:MAG: hypothetical protein Q8R67_22525 [Rhodoferax sp.]|nr:hypothetical protein [Rhodoferax sp.]MDP3654449.1 hypothetical protein [Rhodoferax sp.]
MESRTGPGSIPPGVHAVDSSSQYAGNVGTGLHGETLRSPFTTRPSGVKGAPQLLTEVVFGEWTRSGHTRHPALQGLRTNKPVRHILRQTPCNTRITQENPNPGKPR